MEWVVIELIIAAIPSWLALREGESFISWLGGGDGTVVCVLEDVHRPCAPYRCRNVLTTKRINKQLICFYRDQINKDLYHVETHSF